MDNQRFEDIIREIQESRKKAQQAEELMQSYAQQQASEPTREVQVSEPQLDVDTADLYAESYEPVSEEPYYEHPETDGAPTFEEFYEHQTGVPAFEDAAAAEEPYYEEACEPETYDADGYAVNTEEGEYGDTYAQYDADGYAVNAESGVYGDAAVQYDAEGYPIEGEVQYGAAYEAQYDADGYAVEEGAADLPYGEEELPSEEMIPVSSDMAVYEEPSEYPQEYDANGYPIIYDADGNPLENDIYGYPIQYDANGFLIHYDAEGYPLENDEFGNPILYNEGDVYYGVGPDVQDVAVYSEVTDAVPYEDSFETDGLELQEEPYAEPEMFEGAPEKKGFFSKKRNIIIVAAAALLVILGVVLALVLGGGKEPVEVPEVNGDNVVQEAPEIEETVVLQAAGDAGQKYIDNTLFIGDSNTVRMSFLGVLPEDNTAAIVGAGVGDIGTMDGVYFEELSSPVTILEAIEMMQPGRIVMNFGTNDQKLTSKDFIAAYKQAIEDIKGVCPDADIIVSAIFPVLKSNQYSTSQTVIDEFNEELLKMCEELEMPFLEVTEVMQNLSSGEIKSDYVVSDGIHLTLSGVKAYVSYARTHPLVGGIERPANSGDYTRKETPYVPLEDDKEDPIDQSEMLRQLGLYMTQYGYKQAASDTKFDDTTKWTLTKIEHKITKEQNREGNEDTIAETVWEKVKAQGVAKEAVFRLSCEAGSEEGVLYVTVQLAKIAEHKCDDEANFEEDTTKAVKATCTTDGKKVGKCKLCGKEVTIVVKAEGHKFAEGAKPTAVTGKEPTCEKDGTGILKCTVCQKDIEQPMSKTGHDYENAGCAVSETKAPTCTEPGTKEITCFNGCGTVKKDVPIPALGHDKLETVTTAATCTTDGVMTITCKRSGCTYSTTEPIPALGHDHSVEVSNSATCDAAGEKVKKCSRCDDTVTEASPAKGHSFSAGVCGTCGATDPGYVAPGSEGGGEG